MHVVLQTMAYRLNEETGIIDYDMLEKTAQLYRPKLIVAGASAYPRCISCCCLPLLYLCLIYQGLRL